METTLSEDEVTIPKQIQFEDKQTLTESGATTSIKDGGGRTETIPDPNVDYLLAMGKIATGKWFFLRGDFDFDLRINAGPVRRMAANKPNSVWMDFTTLEITVLVGNDLRLTWAVAGD